MSAPVRVLEVEWKGGCDNGAVKRSHVLAEPGSNAFSHRARVWLEDGVPCGAWWNDGRILGDCSAPDIGPREGRWQRFSTPRIPAALWALAQEHGVEVEARKAA